MIGMKSWAWFGIMALTASGLYACGGDAAILSTGTGGMSTSTGSGGTGGAGGGGGGGGGDAVMMLCAPGAMKACYDGPAASRGIGLCKDGTSVCAEDGQSWGACTGEVLPAAQESCTTAVDDDCNGQVNEGCAVTFAGDVQPIFAAKCAPCHVAMNNGGANLAVNYADTQKNAYSCAGKTKGACSAVRILNGTMPTGMVCSGNPGTDAGKASCLTAAEQATLQAWIAGGQLP